MQNSPQPFNQRVIEANGLTFWTETFGRPENSPILLIHGSGAQGLLWHKEFCEKLAAKNHFVIRYDHRDVGSSSLVDYNKSPYTVLDLAKDALAILDAYDIKKACVVGASMGAEIALLLGAHFSQRIADLVIMMASTDFKPLFDALNSRESTSYLSPPSAAYLTWVKSYLSNPPKTLNDQVAKYLEGGRILTGNILEFEEDLQKQLTLQVFSRMKDPYSSFNHIKAIEASYGLHKEALNKITLPTLILHGDQDPLFPVDHGEDLKKHIHHADFDVIKGMGHALHSSLYDVIIDKIAKF